jgi:hypothetical protein
MVDRLINLQRNNIRNDKLLSEKDLKRIYNRTGGITNETNECIIWEGYITHNKIDYINFYFNGKKCALHRILYINFKGKLNDNDYLEFICSDKYNKGKCCNINHIIKKRYNKQSTPSTPHPPNNSNINSPNINIVYFD